MQTITQIPIKTFACKLISWYFHQVDKLTSKKYVKTIYLLCTGNKVCVKYQAQVGVNLKPPFRTPLLYATPGSNKICHRKCLPTTILYTNVKSSYFTNSTSSFMLVQLF